MGRKSLTEGAVRSCFNSQTFPGRGRVWQAFGLPCAGRSVAHAQASRRSCRFRALKTPPVLPFFRRHFEGSFAIVAGLAQALQIVPVDKAGPVTPVGLDVIHHRGPGPYAPSGALPAPWFPHELIGPQIVCPDGQVVPAVPLSGHPAFRPLGFVLGTPALTGEFLAPRMPARSERLHGHGLSPPGKQKNARASLSTIAVLTGSGVVRSGLGQYQPVFRFCISGNKPEGYGPRWCRQCGASAGSRR